MIFSVYYQSKHKKTAQEIRCPYNQLGLIFNFIKEYPDKRYVIGLTDKLTEEEMKKAIEQIEFVKGTAQDYTIQCGDVSQLKNLREGRYNAFLRFPVTDWETFCELRDLEVSDIYIDGPLGFQVKALAEGKGSIKIRVSPTISPNCTISANRDLSSFFIRPEDLNLYLSAIDVIDFKVNDQDKEDALYSIYTRGSFNYDINQLIKNLPAGINNLMFKEDFAKARLNCGQKCKIPNHHCRLCSNYFHVLDQLTHLVQKK